ncbi:MAG: T6SS immunity protein Tdi1 domain-containing protein [Actinomycetota bacterium]
MAITMDDLTVNFSHLDRESLLSEWRWLIGPSKQPILLAAIGDAYLQDPDDGSVHLLDVGGGALEQIADSVDEFRGLLGDREFVTDSFVPSTIVALRNEGKTLGQGQIYSYIKPPVLGGTYSTDNLEPTDVSVHYSILGQIHRQVKDLPEGTPISSITIE